MLLELRRGSRTKRLNRGHSLYREALEISLQNRRIGQYYNRVSRLQFPTIMSNREQQHRDDNVALQESKPRLKKPRLYKVLLINDDYTPMEFVVIVLERFFSKAREQAVQIMLHVHQKGVGVCGVFPRDIAETKVKMVMDFSQDHQHPLQCTMEPE